MTISRCLLHAGLAFAFTISAKFAAAADWPQFRGPNGNGITEAKNLPTKWGPKENVKWTFKLPGPGNSSPIVSNGKVFITCAEDEGAKRHLYCIDRKTGKADWTRTVEYDKREIMHKTNHWAGSTPAANGKVVVVWHGSAGVYCYDFAGKEQWKADLGEFTHIWGFGSSPVIHDGRVFLNAGPGKRQFVVALGLEDGKQLWKHDEPGGNDSRKGRLTGSWSTPVVAKINDKDQLLCSLPTRVLALDPKDGKILWQLQGLDGPSGDLVYTSPVLSDEIGVAMAGYGGPAVAFRLGGSGDVTKKNTLWKSERRQPQRIGSGIVVGGHVYIANADAGSAYCYELATGKLKWRDRLGAGAHWGSLVLADDKFYVTGQRGTTVVFKPNPEKFELIEKNQLPGTSNSTPAISDGEIFLRTSAGVFCVGKSDTGK